MIKKERNSRLMMKKLPLVIIALVCGGTLNSSAANLRTAVKGAASGTLKLKKKKEKNGKLEYSRLMNRMK